MVAELLELADEATGVGGGVVAAGEPVGAEVLVDGVGSARMCQIMTMRLWAQAKMALPSACLPNRRWKRRNWAPR